MSAHICHWCEQTLIDGREGSGATFRDWCTEDDDYGCDEAPESSDDGCGSHATTEQVNAVYRAAVLAAGEPIANAVRAIMCPEDSKAAHL